MRYSIPFYKLLLELQTDPKMIRKIETKILLMEFEKEYKKKHGIIDNNETSILSGLCREDKI